MTTACPERLHEGSDGAFRNRTQGGFPSSTGTSEVCNTSKNRKIRLHPLSEVPLEIFIHLSSFDCFQLFTTLGPLRAAVLDGIILTLVWEGHCGYHRYLTKLYVGSGSSELG